MPLLHMQSVQCYLPFWAGELTEHTTAVVITTLSHLNQVNKWLSSIIWNQISVKKGFFWKIGAKKNLKNSWKVSGTLRNLLTIILSSEVRKPSQEIYFLCNEISRSVFSDFLILLKQFSLKVASLDVEVAQSMLWRIDKSIKKEKVIFATLFQNHQDWYCRKEWEKAEGCVLK